MIESPKPVVYESLTAFAPDWVVSPGEIIADMLEERGWSKAELATRTSLSEKHINQLLKGDASITQETAIRLEKVLGSTPRYWLGLDAQYREQLAKSRDVVALADYAPWLKELPLADMLKFGWVERQMDTAMQVHECLRFFAVSSVEAWRQQYEKPAAAYRAAPILTRSPQAVSAWLRQGERLAQMQRCADYNKTRFEAVLDAARALTRVSDPAEFFPELQRLCASAGVAVTLAPTPARCAVSGASKWLSPSKALIILSVRGKSDDKLWFTFFHEAAHVLKHGKSLTFLDILGEDGLDPEEEAEADVFARDTLLPKQPYGAFVGRGRFSKAGVCEFAKSQGVSPGIVVGRLQYDRHVPWKDFNGLKIKYQWTHDAT